jgi:hypothetical protein
MANIATSTPVINKEGHNKYSERGMIPLTVDTAVRDSLGCAFVEDKAINTKYP